MVEDYANIVEQSYASSPKYTQIMAGFPEDYNDIKTLGDLLSVNYKLIGVKEQLRQNLIFRIKENKPKYPGIIGFEDDVIPSLDRAILSKHDIFLIGQIGQAKTKLVETIAHHLLSPIPIIENSITNDCPLDLPKDVLISILEGNYENNSSPVFYVSPESIEKLATEKLETKINWIEGKNRYKYVLATPDISVKDLVGYIDAIKIAKKGIEMYKIDSYSPGQLMQAKHGIFCIDELPVLDPRKQVALLSVLQEGRFTTGSYPVIFEPKTTFFATANPIDYTHSGKVIEPLYDRLKSHIHTHYPFSINDEMLIISQESAINTSFISVVLLKTLARLIQNARKSSEINQERGISTRLGIHGLELLVGEAERTRSLHYSKTPIPRISDMACLEQISKFELVEMDDTIENRVKVFKKLIEQSIKETSTEFLENIDNEILNKIKQEFSGNSFQVSQTMVWSNGKISYHVQLEKLPALKQLVESKIQKIQQEQQEFEKKIHSHNIQSQNFSLNEDFTDELKAIIIEIILEGLCWIEPKILSKKEEQYIAA